VIWTENEIKSFLIFEGISCNANFNYVDKINNKNTIPSKLQKNHRRYTKLMPLTHNYLNAHCRGLVSAFQWKETGFRCAPISLLSEMIRSCKCIAHVNKILTIAHKWVNSVVVRKHTLNFEFNTFIIVIFINVWQNWSPFFCKVW
jgi:hypothetical protein